MKKFKFGKKKEAKGNDENDPFQRFDLIQQPVEVENVEDILSPVRYVKQEMVFERITVSESLRATDPNIIHDPRGLCALPNGDVLAIDISQRKLYRISNLQIVEKIATKTVLNSPIGMWADDMSSIYVSNTYANHVFHKREGEKEEDAEKVILGSDTVHGPRGITKDQYGNIFVCDALSNRIVKFSPGATPPITVCNDKNQQEHAFNLPTGLCVLDSGEIIVADCENNCIQKIDLTGKTTVIVGGATHDRNTGGYSDVEPTACSWPYSIRPLGPHLVWVEARNNAVRIMLKSGKVMTLACSNMNGCPGISSPRGLTIDCDYNIYVGAQHSITKISPKPNLQLGLLILLMHKNDNEFQYLVPELVQVIMRLATLTWNF